MILAGLTMLLAFAALWLWWKLSRVEHENTILQVELARLRERARRLRA
jgi:hypothetical protein